MKLKTRSITILTDDEVSLVSGGILTITTDCPDLITFECYSRECDPYETYLCSNRVCLDTEAQCNTEACPDTYAECSIPCG